MSNPTISRQNNLPLVLDNPLSDRNLTVEQDAGGVIPVGAVMGVKSVGAAGSAVAGGGNTGNGTVGTVTKLAGVKAGVYTIKFTAALQFHLITPDGLALAPGAVGTAYASQLGFTVTAGGTPFAAGDTFTITVAAGDGKLKRSVSTATDGSQYPKYINTVEIDATAGDVTGRDFVKSGAIRSAGLVFTGAETSLTVVPGFGGGSFASLLRATGFDLIDGNVITAFDNE